MHTEDFIINDSSESQVVKDICAVPPHIDATILPQALVVESVDLSNLPTLVIPSNQSDSFWVSDFQSKQ